MSLTDIHCRIGLAVVFFAFALGVWGILAYFRKQGVSSGYFGALVIGEVLVIAQGLVGAGLFLTGHFPLDGLHFLYGIVIPLTWVAVYIYTHGEQTRRDVLIYGVVSLFVMGLAIRGIMTGASNPSCLAF